MPWIRVRINPYFRLSKSSVWYIDLCILLSTQLPAEDLRPTPPSAQGLFGERLTHLVDAEIVLHQEVLERIADVLTNLEILTLHPDFIYIDQMNSYYQFLKKGKYAGFLGLRNFSGHSSLDYETRGR